MGGAHPTQRLLRFRFAQPVMAAPDKAVYQEPSHGDGGDSYKNRKKGKRHEERHDHQAAERQHQQDRGNRSRFDDVHAVLTPLRVEG